MKRVESSSICFCIMLTLLLVPSLTSCRTQASSRVTIYSLSAPEHDPKKDELAVYSQFDSIVAIKQDKSAFKASIFDANKLKQSSINHSGKFIRYLRQYYLIEEGSQVRAIRLSDNKVIKRWPLPMTKKESRQTYETHISKNWTLIDISIKSKRNTEHTGYLLIKNDLTASHKQNPWLCPRMSCGYSLVEDDKTNPWTSFYAENEEHGSPYRVSDQLYSLIDPASHRKIKGDGYFFKLDHGKAFSETINNSIVCSPATTVISMMDLNRQGSSGNFTSGSQIFMEDEPCTNFAISFYDIVVDGDYVNLFPATRQIIKYRLSDFTKNEKSPTNLLTENANLYFAIPTTESYVLAFYSRGICIFKKYSLKRVSCTNNLFTHASYGNAPYFAEGATGLAFSDYHPDFEDKFLKITFIKIPPELQLNW